MENNLSDLVITWSLAGLLLFSLLMFTAGFVSKNGQYALSDGSGDIFNSTSADINNRLYTLEGDSKNVSEITSSTDPEKSYLGSKDSVTTAYTTYGSAKSVFQSTQILFSYVFGSAVGKIILMILGALLTFTGIMLIIKLIRQGVGA